MWQPHVQLIFLSQDNLSCQPADIFASLISYLSDISNRMLVNMKISPLWYRLISTCTIICRSSGRFTHDVQIICTRTVKQLEAKVREVSRDLLDDNHDNGAQQN